MLTLYFSCGHRAESKGDETKQPVCPQCGAGLERVIAPPPRFQGVGTSPLKKVRRAS
jgi:hypothetical protein